MAREKGKGVEVGKGGEGEGDEVRRGTGGLE
jgi:hypothetical protein